MADFSKRFKTKEGQFDLYFSKVESFTMKKYFIRVIEHSRQIAAFDMKQNENGEWKVVEPAPYCIVRAEDKISKVIEEQTLTADGEAG